ncbi:hypothetical protein [Burkholderia cepacia]|uniref:hypothetical protein n=1 Tax=Burkholderia cepacia TaxID=292 RepID=UPI002AB6C026|nr:hypothetical protein [Burkholderia cepacia]
MLGTQELVAATLGDITADARGALWLKVGATSARAALPLLARDALRRALKTRGLPVMRTRWRPATPLVTNPKKVYRANAYAGTSISAARLRQV